MQGQKHKETPILDQCVLLQQGTVTIKLLSCCLTLYSVVKEKHVGRFDLFICSEAL